MSWAILALGRQVTTGLAAARQSTHFQLAGEATRLLGQPGAPRYRHILVDEAQDLHPAQWRLLRAAVDPGPDDLFIAADPHQRIHGNRVALASLRISVRGRSRRLSLNYRTTQEILAWALPLLGTDPVTGLDGEADSLLGYRSPMHGPRPQAWQSASRTEEFGLLAERVRSWLSAGLEPHAIGVTARSAALIREAREALEAAGIATASLSGRSHVPAVRAGTMHAMKGVLGPPVMSPYPLSFRGGLGGMTAWPLPWPPRPRMRRGSSSVSAELTHLVATFGGQDQTFRLRGPAQTLNSSGWSRRASDSAISRSPSAWVLRSWTRPRGVFSPMYLATRGGGSSGSVPAGCEQTRHSHCGGGVTVQMNGTRV